MPLRVAVLVALLLELDPEVDDRVADAWWDWLTEEGIEPDRGQDET